MTTVLDSLEQALRSAGSFHQGEVTAPTCVLWPDPTCEWMAAAGPLRERLPFLTLGSFHQESGAGPAIWIRTQVDPPRPVGAPLPVVYLPGVSRDELRGEVAAEALRPLVDLQYRGTVFERRDRKPWTVASFLGLSRDGLGIEVTPGARAGVARSLDTLLTCRVADLKARTPLTAQTLQLLTYPDLAGELLRWLNGPPQETPAGFREAVAVEYGLDLSEGPLAVTSRLATRAGSLGTVWERYEASPRLYPHLRAHLLAAGPAVGQTWTPEQAAVWPQVNQVAEGLLQAALHELTTAPAATVRERLLALEQEHGGRRDLVWAKLDEAPLACALRPLSEVARRTSDTLSGNTLTEIADAYAGDGHLTDGAVLDALGSVRSDAHLTLVGAVLRGLYLEWLERVNAAFIGAAQTDGAPAFPTSAQWNAFPGLAVLFVDGLRYDVAARLVGLLASESVRLDWQLAATPTLTPTAKPAVAPIRGELEVLSAGKLTLSHLGRAVTAPVLREVVGEHGFLPVTGTPLPDPAGAAWLEFGDLDSLGHQDGLRLPSRLEGELERIRDRVLELLGAGFREVRVVTDHGWLLVPGGLPKAELPASLPLLKKSRCAVLGETNSSEFPTRPWTWDTGVQITLAPGIHSFEAGVVYAHGGLSLQESVTPVLTVKREGASVAVKFTSVRWVNNRCKVETTGAQGLTLDLRRKATDASSSMLTAPKAVGADGSVSLLVAGDDLEGVAAVLVALREGQVVRQRPVTVGEGA